MKQTLTLISLLLLLAVPAGAQRLRPPHRSFPPRPSFGRDRPIRVHTAAYLLHDRVFIKWTPSSLIPISAATVRIGAEYCLARHFGLGLDFGYVFKVRSSYSPYYSFNHGGGFQLNPEARYYFGERFRSRGFAGVQGLYRVQYFGAERGSLGLSGSTYEYSQSGANMRVGGVAAEIGFLARLAGNFHLEMAGGLGVKQVNYDRRDMTLRKTYDSFHDYMQFPEYGVLDRGALPYFFLQLKLSWLLGRPVIGGHS